MARRGWQTLIRWFKPKPPIDNDEFDWLVACFAWLQRTLDPSEPFRQSLLALPSVSHFDVGDFEGYERATHLFEQVKHWLGMEEWPCTLVAQEERRENRISDGLLLQHERESPLGTFEVSGNAASISYDPALLNKPEKLIATFAHELAHYLLAGHGDPPGGHNLREHATDCAAVYLGFGVYLANSAFTFSQFSDGIEQGWERQASGYLSELSLVTATAIFVHCTNGDEVAAGGALKDYLQKPFARAMKAVQHRLPKGAAELDKVDLEDWA